MRKFHANVIFLHKEKRRQSLKSPTYCAIVMIAGIKKSPMRADFFWRIGDFYSASGKII